MNGTKVPTHRPHQHGAVLAYVGIAMLLFMAFAVIGVDVGRLAFTAAEVQSVADVGATAGAVTLLKNRDDGVLNDPKVEALAVVGQNRVDGQTPTMTASDIILGVWDWDSNAADPFTGPVSVDEANAVRATANATVQNYVAAVVGDQTSSVQREATAALTGPCDAKALPIAVSECIFTQYQGDGNCSSLPALVQVPTPQETACWTSLSTGNAGSSTLLGLLGSCTESDGADVSVGDPIKLGNGADVNVIRAVQDCVAAGNNEFTIPVIKSPCPCSDSKCPGLCTSTREIEGFATVTITAVYSGTQGDPQCPPLPCCDLPTTDPNYCDCQGLNKCIRLASICKADTQTGRGGCEDNGTLIAVLVR